VTTLPLTTVSRLKLLTQLSEHFANSSYALIDAALEAFDVTTLSSWDGDKPSYVIHLLKTASDDALLGLGEYAGLLHTQDTGVSSQQGAGNSERKFERFRLFISHVAVHKDVASSLSQELRKFGISGFVAHADIKPTVEWLSEIERRLGRCDALLALLHDGFKGSDWTEQEVGWVLGRQKPVFAVRFDLAPYGFFGKAQAFNANGKTSASLAREIFRRLADHPETSAAISHAVVGHYRERILRTVKRARGSARSIEVLGRRVERKADDVCFGKRSDSFLIRSAGESEQDSTAIELMQELSGLGAVGA
jgi:hypothetical protein